MREYLTKAPIPLHSILESEFVWVEFFENIPRYAFATLGTYSRAYKSPNYPTFGNYCCHFEFISPGAAVDDYCYFGRQLFIKKSPKMSLSTYFQFGSGAQSSAVEIKFFLPYFSRNKYYGFGAYINPSTKKVYVRVPGPDWTEIATLTDLLYSVYYQFEITFNLLTEKYDKIIVGDREIDASAYGPYIDPTFHNYSAIQLFLRAKEINCKESAQFGHILVRSLFG